MKVVRTFFLAVPQLILPQKMLDPHLYLFPLYEKNTETQDSECFIRVSAFRTEKEILKFFFSVIYVIFDQEFQVLVRALAQKSSKMV